MSAFNKKWLVLPVVAVVAAAGYGAWTYASTAENTTIDAEHAFDDSQALQDWAEASAVTAVEPQTGEAPAANPAPPTTLSGPVSTPENTPAVPVKRDLDVVVDGAAPTAPRTLGSVDAPVTIIDYSSLTCPHCATAHANIMPRLIEDYVNTGKVRIIFNDFPLNQQALDASKVARCVANDQYFGFLSMLFSSIEQWGYGNDHPNALINNAALTGLSQERARECLNDSAIEEAILKDIQSGVSLYQVNSTPTFVLNNGAQTIRGAQPYDVFKRAIEAELEKKK